jgi:peroxiredoxin Q/BCP
MSRFADLFATLGLQGESTVRSGELAIGSTAPDFTLPATDGQTYRLATLLAERRFVVLVWYPRAFTPVCTLECRAVSKASDSLGKFDVALFGVSVDPVERNQKFAELLGLRFPILCDPQRTTARAYGVVKSTDRGMAKRWTFFIGPDGKILHIDKAVGMLSHGQDIAAMLKVLGAPLKNAAAE